MPRAIADVLLVSPNDYIRPVSIELGEDGRFAAIHEGHRPPDGIEVIFDGGGEIYATAGLTHLTHYCNQMSALHHRNVGLVGAGLLDDGVMIELICDGIHLCDDMIRLVFKHRSCDRLMLITDSIAAAHLGDGTYPLNDGEIIVKDGQARIPAGNLAGSVVTFDDALRRAARITGLPLNELSKTCAANQARSLRLDDRGRIQEGLLADFTLLTPGLEVVATYVGGEMRYAAA